MKLIKLEAKPESINSSHRFDLVSRSWFEINNNGQEHEGDFRDPLEPFLTRLKIRRVFGDVEPDLVVTSFDFTTSFETASPSYHRGRKVGTNTLCPKKGDIVVMRVFSDRVINGKIEGIEINVFFFNEIEEVGFHKELFRPLNKFEVRTMLRKRRERQIDYLSASVEDTPYESFIGLVTGHFQKEIRLYIDHGSDVFEKALENETDPTIVKILSTKLPRNDNPSEFITVKNSILYQMGKHEL